MSITWIGCPQRRQILWPWYFLCANHQHISHLILGTSEELLRSQYTWNQRGWKGLAIGQLRRQSEILARAWQSQPMMATHEANLASIRHQGIWPNISSLGKCLFRVFGGLEMKELCGVATVSAVLPCALSYTAFSLPSIRLITPVTPPHCNIRHTWRRLQRVFSARRQSEHFNASSRPYVPNKKDAGSLQASEGLAREFFLFVWCCDFWRPPLWALSLIWEVFLLPYSFQPEIKSPKQEGQ